MVAGVGAVAYAVFVIILAAARVTRAEIDARGFRTPRALLIERIVAALENLGGRATLSSLAGAVGQPRSRVEAALLRLELDSKVRREWTLRREAKTALRDTEQVSPRGGIPRRGSD